VQGHACGEGGREHGRCRRVWPQDSAPHEARSGVDVHTNVGMAAREACIYVRVVYSISPQRKDIQDVSTIRAPHQTNHNTCGRAAWYVTTNPPVCTNSGVGLDEASLLDRSRVYVAREWLVALTYTVWLVCSALATGTGRWRGCTAQPWDHPLTHRGAHGCLPTWTAFSGPCLHARAAPALH
jgi:hypothetical protein